MFSVNYDHVHFEFSRTDALVAERLTASPRIYNIFGACGIGIMSEYFQEGDIEHIVIPHADVTIDFSKAQESLISYNSFSVLNKLEISLQMAEALADLHGYPAGPIVHQDVVSSVLKPITVDWNKNMESIDAALLASFVL